WISGSPSASERQMPGPISHSHRPIGALIAAATLLFAGCSQSGPEIKGSPPDMRRLTEDQYSNIIRDVFGEGITIAGKLDPLIRTEGLLAIGARSARITPSGFEQYDHLATSIAS